MIVDDVFLPVSSASWRLRNMDSDSDSAIGTNMIDNELALTRDGTLGSRIARDFRIPRVHGTHGPCCGGSRSMTQRTSLTLRLAMEEAERIRTSESACC
jgi:hypothetical protein